MSDVTPEQALAIVKDWACQDSHPISDDAKATLLYMCCLFHPRRHRIEICNEYIAAQRGLAVGTISEHVDEILEARLLQRIAVPYVKTIPVYILAPLSR